jgi:transcriptional regulator with XRE-family HTH domain
MKKYKNLIRRARQTVEYWTQLAMRDFVRDLNVRLQVLDMNRAQLAEKIDVSPAYVSKVMRGDVNFTLETMTKLAMATGGRLRVGVVPLPGDKSEVVAQATWNLNIGCSGAAFEQLRDFDFRGIENTQAANEQWVSVKIPRAASVAVAAGNA